MQLAVFQLHLTVSVASHSQVMVDARKNRLPDQTAVEGRWLLMDVHFPPFMGFPLRNTAHEQITAVDHEHRRIAWVATPLPRSLLNTVRWQVLTITSDGRTRYENVLMFYGMLGHVVRWVLGKRLKHGFDSTAAALKRRAEST